MRRQESQRSRADRAELVNQQEQHPCDASPCFRSEPPMPLQVCRRSPDQAPDERCAALRRIDGSCGAEGRAAEARRSEERSINSLFFLVDAKVLSFALIRGHAVVGAARAIAAPKVFHTPPSPLLQVSSPVECGEMRSSSTSVRYCSRLYSYMLLSTRMYARNSRKESNVPSRKGSEACRARLPESEGWISSPPSISTEYLRLRCRRSH